MTSPPNAIHTRSAVGSALPSAFPAVVRPRLVVYRPCGAMSERAVYVRLTAEQVESIVHPAQGVSAASLAALLSGRIEGIPPVEVWEERAHDGTVESRFSFSLVRGLLLLAHLADGQPARLTDLAADLNLSERTAGTYTPIQFGGRIWRTTAIVVFQKGLFRTATCRSFPNSWSKCCLPMIVGAMCTRKQPSTWRQESQSSASSTPRQNRLTSIIRMNRRELCIGASVCTCLMSSASKVAARGLRFPVCQRHRHANFSQNSANGKSAENRNPGPNWPQL